MTTSVEEVSRKHGLAARVLRFPFRHTLLTVINYIIVARDNAVVKFNKIVRPIELWTVMTKVVTTAPERFGLRLRKVLSRTVSGKHS